MDIMNFVKPELLVLVPVLWILGNVIKTSNIKTQWLPLILLGVSVVLSLGYVLAFEGVSSTGVWTAIVQGILVAGLESLGYGIKREIDKM